jgi:hypothetical protein
MYVYRKQRLYPKKKNPRRSVEVQRSLKKLRQKPICWSKRRVDVVKNQSDGAGILCTKGIGLVIQPPKSLAGESARSSVNERMRILEKTRKIRKESNMDDIAQVREYYKKSLMKINSQKP